MEEKNKLGHSAAELMPRDKLSYKILLERAKKLAQKSEVIENQNMVNYIRFRLADNEYYGISYQSVEEVIDNVAVTKIPFAHECVAGVINYRGMLLTLIDLKKFFQIPSSNESLKKDVIVTKIGDIFVGFWVTNIEGINEYDKEKIKNEMLYQGVINPRYLLGIQGEITTLLNIETIVQDLQSLLGRH